MSLVELSTMDRHPDQPSLAEIARRRELGLDMFDEWWDGEYRIVTSPARQHQRRVIALLKFFDRLIGGRSLEVLPAMNLGIDKQSTRTPDVVVMRPDTPRTSRAFFTTAELVVEVLSPGEPAGLKLDFYAQWHVDEYLEIDEASGAARLLRREGAEWVEAERSKVLDFGVDGGVLVHGDERLDLAAFED
jgi:Uma2 family endonuclease